ncbi:putative odorant receptor 71a [Leptopilina boulardi]|uniref:putative odorant receptor 71a n=1 Tax=Leptopilina boulardi TaxID=63433 RepID=UPI0021F67B03|nr:putative odorant receptor 71a [Leptopilina boulardi]
MIAYCSCMLLQIFLYTFYGNKLIEKSQSVADAVYNSDWLNVDSAQRRELKFIMQISSKGTILSHHGQCILNLNTFVWIVKASYTALSVLRNGTSA